MALNLKNTDHLFFKMLAKF